MHVLIAHQSPTARTRLETKLSGMSVPFSIHATSELTETYHYAEHKRPDCALISGHLANCAEFELLASLLRILGISCVVVEASPQPMRLRLSARASQHVVRVTEDASDADLMNAMQRVRTPSPPSGFTPKHCNQSSDDAFDAKKIILIGASTGGVDALLKVIKHFGPNCPPTLIVQHTGGSFARSLIRLLDGGTAASVQDARDGSDLKPGTIYLAPSDDTHLSVARSKPHRIDLKRDDLISGHRPSVDALFQSAIPHAKDVIAAILTGMGRDGASGITALRRAGARTFGQDEATSVVYGMPRVANELGGVEKQLPIDQMGDALLRATMLGVRA